MNDGKIMFRRCSIHTLMRVCSYSAGLGTMRWDLAHTEWAIARLYISSASSRRSCAANTSARFDMTSPRSGSSFRTCSNAFCARPYSLLCSKSRLPRLQRVVTSAYPSSSSVSTRLRSSAGPTDGTSPVRRVHTNTIYSVLHERVLKCAPSGFFDRDSLRIFSAPKHRRACTFCLLMLSLWSHRPHGYTR